MILCLTTRSPKAKSNCLTEQDLNQAFTQAEIKLEQTLQAGISWVSYYDPRYPSVLKEVKSLDGKRLESPVLLYYKGNLQLLLYPSVAIIGSRQAQPHAQKAAEFLSYSFAVRGLNIISGLALGCDSYAHKGAIKAGTGKTIAVLGNGLDRIYPAQNKDLAMQIIEAGGLLISEYEHGQSAANYTLVARDLLQAGISKAVIVVQSKRDGGSMHAAISAANAGKPLYVVKYSDPNFDRSEYNEGNHILVQEHNAIYLTAIQNKTKMSQYLDTIANSVIK